MSTEASGTGRRAWIAIAVVVGAIVALNLLARGLDQAVGGNEPSGVAGSSYATRDDGLAAYASLVARWGHAVTRQRGSLARAVLDPDETLIVVDPTVLTEDDAGAALQFVNAGGRLVIGGPRPFYLRLLRDRPPSWNDGGRLAYREIDTSFGNVRTIETAGNGRWERVGAGHAVVREADDVLLTAERVGRGEMLFLADVTPLENAYLARADDAAFGLRLAGASGRRVVFAEGVHGYGNERGLRAIPTRWKYALSGMALAALLYVWSRARRLGPPDQLGRELPPARAEYVRALALTLERARDHPGALAPLQRWARARIAARAGLRPDAPDEQVDRAARELGCTADERAALHAPPRDDDAVLALGRAVTRVNGETGRSS